MTMVFFFTSTVVDPPVTLFMGLDKHENEELIKWGWPEDVWFHVDKVTFQAIKKSTSLRNVMTKLVTEFLTETLLLGQLCSRIFEAGTWTNLGRGKIFSYSKSEPRND